MVLGNIVPSVTVAAVFDLDNTLVRGSFLFHFGVQLMRDGLVSPRHLAPFLVTEFRYVHGRQERDTVPERIARCTLRLARGRSQSHIAQLADDFTRRRLNRFLLPHVADVARRLQREGVTVLLATASPQELAESVAARLGLSGAIGTVGEVRDGRYTGRLASPIAHGSTKALRVSKALHARGCDPLASWAFSDSVNDLPLLSSVGHPVAVRPDRHLRRIAEQNNWPVIEEASTDYCEAMSGKVVATSAASGKAWTAAAATQPPR